MTNPPRCTQTAFSAPAQPACFPLKSACRGSHCAVSMGDKMALLAYGYANRQTNKELADEAGVSTRTIGTWRKEVERDKGRTGNKLDNKRLDLIRPAAPAVPPGSLQDSSIEEDASSFDAAFQAAYREPSAPEPAPVVRRAPRVEIPSGKYHMDWTREEKLALLHLIKTEGATNRSLAELAGTNVVVVSAWRRELGLAGHRNAPSDLSVEDRKILLQMQQDEGLTNRQVADLGGIAMATVSVWRRDYGYAGTRGAVSVLSDQEKRDLFARGKREGLDGTRLGEIAGVSRQTIYGWRAELAKKDRLAAAMSGVPVGAEPQDLVQVMAPPWLRASAASGCAAPMAWSLRSRSAPRR